MMFDLKPCPFCGETAKIIRIRRGYERLEKPYVAVCQNELCGASIGQYSATQQDAADGWNKRDGVETVQHGRWILDSSDEYADHYSCSRCGAEIDLCNEIYSESTPEYCQHCGAKMDGTEGA